MANVGKYTIHWASGHEKQSLKKGRPWFPRGFVPFAVPKTPTGVNEKFIKASSISSSAIEDGDGRDPPGGENSTQHGSDISTKESQPFFEEPQPLEAISA